MSDRVKALDKPTIPPLKLYLLGKDTPAPTSPVDPEKQPGSKAQRLAEVEYNKTIVVSERRLGKLNELPLEVPQAKLLDTIVTDARHLADKKDFLGACAELNRVSSSKLKDKGRSFAKDRVKDAKKNFPAAVKLANTINGVLAKPATLLMSDAEAGEFRDRIKSALHPLYQQDATDDDGTDALEALTKIETEIKANRDEYAKIKPRTETLQTSTRDQLKRITTQLPAEVLAPLRERLDGVGTLMSENQWESAERTLKAVGDDVTAQETALSTKANAAQVARDREAMTAGFSAEGSTAARALATRLSEVGKKGQALHDAPATAGLYVPFPDPNLPTIKGMLERTIKEGMGKGLTPEQAKSAFSSIGGALETAEKRVALLATPRVAEASTLGLKKVADACARVDTAVTTLRAALKLLGVDADSVCKPFEDERNTIDRRYSTDVKAATSVDKIDPKQALTALVSLYARVTALAADDGALDAIVGKTETDGARQAFDVELEQAQDAVDALLVMDPDAAEASLEALRKLTAEGQRAAQPAVFQALADKAGAVAKQAKDAAGTTGVAAARDALDAALSKAQPLVQQFATEVEKKRKVLWVEGDNKEGKYGDLRDFLVNTLQEQLAARLVDSLVLLNEAADAARQLAADANDALDDLHGKKPEGSGKTTLGTHADQLARQRKRLDSNVVTTFGGESAKALKIRIEELDKQVKSLPLREGKTAISTLTKDCTDLLTASVDAQEAYKTWKKGTETVQKEIKGLGDDARELKKYLTEQIKECLQLGRREGGLDHAKNTLTQIEQLIQNAKDDPAVLSDRENTAKLRKKQAQDDKTVWKARYDAAVKRAKEATGILSKNRSEIITLMDQANGLFKKTADFELAAGQLDVALARVDFVAKNPEGVELTRRKNLPTVEKKWREKLQGMKAAFNTLVKDHVMALDPAAAPVEVKDAVRNAVAEAAALFNPGEFEGVVKVMTDAHRSNRDKLAERERALRRIDALLRQFEGNPLLRQLQNNPFMRNEVHAGIASSRFALLDMQNNLLGCMPKNAYDTEE